mmetsp:Transcript_67/g.192  ORF Transcript_67/g.192 Transcript_67/m.192 type:complete len:225 (-) Transcript_67:664-1338(-)
MWSSLHDTHGPSLAPWSKAARVGPVGTLSRAILRSRGACFASLCSANQEDICSSVHRLEAGEPAWPSSPEAVRRKAVAHSLSRSARVQGEALSPSSMEVTAPPGSSSVFMSPAMRAERVPKPRVASMHLRRAPTRCSSLLASRCTQKTAVGCRASSPPPSLPARHTPTRVVSCSRALAELLARATISRSVRNSRALPIATSARSTRSLRAAIWWSLPWPGMQAE